MRKTLLASTFAVLAQVPTLGHTDDLAQVQAQFEIMTQRMDKLEQRNGELQQENETLQKALAANAARTGAESKPDLKTDPKLDSWVSRLNVQGDVRYRKEVTDTDADSSVRDRDVLRARLGLDARVNDAVRLGIGLTTGENGNPRGANQTLDGEFSRKSLDLDLAYVDWAFANSLHAIAGKMKTPYFRPGQSLFLDNDINPEGLALTFAGERWFASAFRYWVDENVPVSGTTATSADAMLHGLQVGMRLPLRNSSLTLAAMYQDLSDAEGHRPFFNGSANGNSVLGTGSNAVLALDYQVVQLSGEFNTTIWTRPLQLWTEVARNGDAQLDGAYALGARLGKASAPGSWETGVAYQVIEKDALFAQLIDSDFAGGVSDSQGWVFRFAYAPMKNWSLSSTYFVTQNNVDVGTRADHERFMLDLNFKF